MAKDQEKPDAMAETASPSNEENLEQKPSSASVQRQPGPATNGRFFCDDKRQHSMDFSFCANPSTYPKKAAWKARLFVKCDDVPRLMREGFHWDNANVVKEDGFLYFHNSSCFNKPKYENDFLEDGKSWGGIRYYFLKDLQDPPRWIAGIKVYGTSAESIGEFDLECLSHENILFAHALSQDGHPIYCFSRNQPKKNINAIYGTTPMEGWWPWPRKTESDAKQEPPLIVAYRTWNF
ncbi:hypothetical protein F4808DRAFT_467981 [Astrocystis sublimbata]|nr:hypothetical protein F4808DRAFT_467981 [Astrocystis sublimbata]